MPLLDWLKGRPSIQPTPQQFLAAIQKQHPPIPTPGHPPDYDHAKWLYSSLESRLPLQLRQYVNTGAVAFGEIGFLTPNAFAQFVPPNGYAIQVYTGLSHFLYRVARALYTRTNLLGDDGSVAQATTATMEQTVAMLAEIFRNFIHDGRIQGPSGYSISRQQINLASNLATHAEIFALAHEIGHIIHWLRQGRGPETFAPTAEFEADQNAMEFILGWHADPAAAALQRMAYAGAEFTVRVFASLDHLGYKFEATHPPPGERLQQIRRGAEAICGSRRAFMMLSTIAFGNDQLLEAVEREVAGPQAAAGFVVGPTPERLLSSLSVLIEECAKGVVTEEFVVKETVKILAGVPDDILLKTAEEAARMYSPQAPTIDLSVFPTAGFEEMKFRKILLLLPEPARKVFANAVLQQDKAERMATGTRPV